MAAETIKALPGTFEWALAYLKLGRHVRRGGWSEHHNVRLGHNVRAVGADLLQISVDKFGLLVSWRPRHDDLLADDWELLPEEDEDG